MCSYEFRILVCILLSLFDQIINCQCCRCICLLSAIFRINVYHRRNEAYFYHHRNMLLGVFISSITNGIGSVRRAFHFKNNSRVLMHLVLSECLHIQADVDLCAISFTLHAKFFFFNFRHFLFQLKLFLLIPDLTWKMFSLRTYNLKI